MTVRTRDRSDGGVHTTARSGGGRHAPSDLPSAALYVGSVIHKRMRPVPHALSYRVFALLIDVDQIEQSVRRCRLLSHNRFNVFSVYDSDHGAGDGMTLAEIARQALQRAGRHSDGRRILVLTYPRVLGYVFNPISVFYVFAPDDTLESLVYEVSNTFSERTSYVVAAGPVHGGRVYAQATEKHMYVSPFTEMAGSYGFRVTAPDEEAVLAVLLRDRHGALLKTHFRGRRAPLSDRTLARLFVTAPLLTLKVTAAIHYEAFKLWWKGVPLTPRKASPPYTTTPVLHDEKT